MNGLKQQIKVKDIIRDNKYCNIKIGEAEQMKKNFCMKIVKVFSNHTNIKQKLSFYISYVQFFIKFLNKCKYNT